jgi:hypothetical protein
MPGENLRCVDDSSRIKRLCLLWIKSFSVFVFIVDIVQEHVEITLFYVGRTTVAIWYECNSCVCHFKRTANVFNVYRARHVNIELFPKWITLTRVSK